jgi:hypothetical protein
MTTASMRSSTPSTARTCVGGEYRAAARSAVLRQSVSIADGTNELLGERDPVRIRVMWDWHAFPEWGNTAIDELPISEPLRRRLQHWSDARTNAKGAIRMGWDDDGRRLVEQLRTELGPDALVGYRNERTGLDEWP